MNKCLQFIIRGVCNLSFFLILKVCGVFSKVVYYFTTKLYIIMYVLSTRLVPWTHFRREVVACLCVTHLGLVHIWVKFGWSTWAV
jgi:hypothetical protein